MVVGMSQPQCIHLRKPIGMQSPKRLKKRMVVVMSQHRDVRFRQPIALHSQKR